MLRAWPTAEGRWALGALVVVGLAALMSGNNAVHLLLAGIAGGHGASLALGWANVTALRPSRRLPAELFAGTDNEGALVVENVGKRDAVSLVVVDQSSGAEATVARVVAGGRAEGRCRFVFGDRGLVGLGKVTVGSDWPFGWWRFEREASVEVEVLVWPRPLQAGPVPRWQGQLTEMAMASPGGEGEFVGLRAFRDGDPPRSVHWRTTARVGEPMVVERSHPVGGQIVVEVPALRGPAMERAIGRATRQVVEGFREGLAVGLQVEGSDELAPRTGPGWRRVLLERLAMLPVEPR